ncbi:MAG: dihydropteroate synthase [Acidobacteria bacterium]|nr:dihydropteroate synthase [Acidobacteriota bacterium]
MPVEVPPAAPPHVPRRVSFVTGRLAAPELRRVLDEAELPFAWNVEVLGITVAALMTTSWIARHLATHFDPELVVIPGLCEGDTTALAASLGTEVVRGPKDLREIPGHFGLAAGRREYGAWDIEIVAEINDVPRLPIETVLVRAAYYRDAGADVIDIGCTPGVPFPGLGTVVARLVADGYRVSVDSLDGTEIRAAVAAGAELVLSIARANLDVVPSLAGTGARVVAIGEPDEPVTALEPVLDALARAGVPYLVDPILAPIGHGFAASLARYAEARRRWPDAEMLMGVGNVTELTAADSTGVHAVLVAICQELGIRTVLTTEVASWTRGAVRELDVARRVMHHAVGRHVAPKGIDDRLLTVKDAAVLAWGEAELRDLQARITDPNFRVFADRDAITVLSRDVFVRGTDTQAIFASLGVTDVAHAFYLGEELARAELAMRLGKTYRQDAPLAWGYLTPDEPVARPHVRLARSEPPRGRTE